MVADKHTGVVTGLGLGLVTIMVNHRAMDLVTNLAGLLTWTTVNRPDKPVFSGGATAAWGTSTTTFLAMTTRGDSPDR